MDVTACSLFPVVCHSHMFRAPLQVHHPRREGYRTGNAACIARTRERTLVRPVYGFSP